MFAIDGRLEPEPVLEALGRAIYRRRIWVLAVWAATVLAAAPFAPRAGELLKPGGFSDESFPSVQARQLMQDRLGLSTMTVELIFRHPEWTAYQPEFRQAVADAVEPLSGLGHVNSVRTHLGDPSRVSEDGHHVHVSVGMDAQLEESLRLLDETVAAVDPGPLELTVTGGPALYRDISLASERDLRRSETIAFPLATLTLLLVFGTLVAAITPAAVGGAGVILGLAAVYLMSQGVDLSVFALNIVSLLGIGLGIDFSLFYVSRFREELAAGRSVEDAIAVSQTQAGRAILFSAITSLIGLVSLLAFDLMMLRSVGLGAMVVITAALLAAMTLLPALLGVLGHRVDRLRFGPNWDTGRSFWAPLSRWVMRRPVLVLVVSSALLILMALPVRNLRLGTVDATILPETLESRRGFEILEEQFGLDVNTVIPVACTFEGDPFSDENLPHLYAFGKALEGVDQVDRVVSIVNLQPEYGLEQYRVLYARPESVTGADQFRLVRETVGPGIALFIVESDLHPFSPEARRLVAEVRAFDPGPGRALHVDGGAADLSDVIDALYSRFPLVIAVVLAVTYLSLLLLFRSVVLPLKAVVLNVLSVLASYGVLVLVFQEGVFSGLLGFEPLGLIEATTPILLFAILFGLSMDYEIFLLSRVAEAYRRTGDNAASVSEGLQKSGLIITGAAAILIVVAASFVAADVVLVKAIGLGLAVAIFVDATIVRALVAPAMMRLFGEWNWWLPRWLDRLLPEVRHVG